MAEVVEAYGRRLPVGPVGRRSLGWWGVMTLIASEAALFAYLLFSYYFIASHNTADWLPNGPPSLKLSGPNTVILLISSLTAWIGERALTHRDRLAQARVWLLLTLMLGAVFLTVQGFEWAAKREALPDTAYSALYFTITGFHTAHVIAGLIGLLGVQAWLWRGNVNRVRSMPMLGAVIYWHFVDAVWLCVFTTFYVTPRIW